MIPWLFPFCIDIRKLELLQEFSAVQTAAHKLVNRSLSQGQKRCGKSEKSTGAYIT